MRSNHPRGLRSRQNGSTLIVSMMMLIMVMMIGITAIMTSDTQFKLAGNLQFENNAMNNAETAIATGEQWLSSGSNYNDAGFTTYSTATSELHPIGHLAGLTAPANDPLTLTWSDSNSKMVSTDANKRYLIEMISKNSRLLGSNLAQGGHNSTGCNQVNTYQITARGLSARGATKFIQTYYSVLSC